MSQDRLRKLTDDNRELAANLRREAVAQNAPKPVAKSIGKTRRGQGSEIGSGRGSEERTSSIPAGGARGSKRARDNDIEKVGGPSFDSERSHNSPFPSDGVALAPENLDTLGKSVSGPYQFPAPWNHISGTLDDAGDQDDAKPAVPAKPSGPTKIRLTVKPVNMAKDRAPNSVPNKSLDLARFIHVPRRAAVKASGALSSAGSMGPPPSRLQTGTPKPKQDQGADQQLSSEDDTITVTAKRAKRAKRAEDTSITKPNKEKRVPQSSSFTFTSSSPLNEDPQQRSPSITTSSVRSSHSGDLSRRRRAGTSTDNLVPSFSTRGSTMADPNARDEAYWTPERQQQMQTESIDEILARPAPPDEPEQFSKETARQRDKQHFASLIGGTTMQEKAIIEDELEEAGKLTRKLTEHPGYIKSMREDPGNFNKKLFYQGVAPGQHLEIAGVDADPLTIDPPGSGGPFDALRFPERLVQQLNRDDADTLIGWDETALLKIPKKLMDELHPHILAKMPFNVLMKLPFSIQEKLPNNHPFFEEQNRREEEAAAARSAAPRRARVLRSSTPAISNNANPPEIGRSALQSTSARSTMSATSGSSTFQSLFDSSNLPPHGLLGSADNTPSTASVDDQLEDQGPCTTCVAMGVKCNRRKPICHWCSHAGYECSFNIKPKPAADFLYSSETDAAQQLNLGSDTAHLNLGPDTNIPKELQPKPTFGKGPNVEKKANRKRNAEQLRRTQLFDRDGNFVTPGQNRITYTGTYLQEENYHNRPSIRISIPDHLKNLLVDDWENVTKSLLLVPLPSQTPANFILDEYFNEEKTNRRLGSVEADILEEFCVGLKTYFEKAIGKILLYRFERSQLNDVSQ